MISDPTPKVLNYIYNNQNFDVLRPDLDEKTTPNVYSLAHVLEMKKLKDELEHYIQEKILDPENVTKFYLEGLRFNSQRLQQACETMLVEHFDEVAKSEEGMEFFSVLPFEPFLKLIRSNDINIESENVVVKLVDTYLNRRKGLPLLAEEDPKNDWTHLTEEEKAAREEAKKNTEDEKNQAEEEAKAKKQEEFESKNDVQKVQTQIHDKIEEEGKEINKVLEVVRMNKAQRKMIFEAIRYSFLSHEELIDTAKNPNFEEVRNFVLEGMSCRLDPFEHINNRDNFHINLEPRESYSEAVRQAKEAAKAAEEKAAAEAANKGMLTQISKARGSAVASVKSSTTGGKPSGLRPPVTHPVRPPVFASSSGFAGPRPPYQQTAHMYNSARVGGFYHQTGHPMPPQMGQTMG